MWNPLKQTSWRRLYYKVVQQEGSPESVARGAAIGLFLGLVLPIGFQTIVALPLAFMLKANKILSILFTMVTNPWTVLFIYPVQCYLGSVLLFDPMSMSEINEKIHHLIADPSWERLSGLGGDVLLPFFAGGLLFGAVAAPIGYYACYGMVQRYRRRKEAKLRARLSKESRRMHTTVLNIQLDTLPELKRRRR